MLQDLNTGQAYEGITNNMDIIKREKIKKEKVTAALDT
jgi:hypothetical protein